MLSNEYNYLDERVIAYINYITKDRSDFDEAIFSDWLAKCDVENKTNPSGYVRSCFFKELKSGTFKPQQKLELDDLDILTQVMPNLYKYLPMFDMDIHKGFEDETFFIENLQLYIVKNKILTIDELKTLNSKVMSYIVNFENPKISDYREYIKKSQLLKGKVDWEEVSKIEDKAKVKFETLMKQFVEDYESEVSEIVYD